MKPFRRLILPVDGSAAANGGIAFGAQLAKSEGAEIDVCSVIDEAAIMLPIAEGAVINPAPLIEAMEATTAKQTSEAVALLNKAGVIAHATVLRGNPAAEIDVFARREHADAIVLGTNVRGGIERMFMGSVTRALLCIADVPVITVHLKDTFRPGPMLVAVDASSASLAALECAIERARVSGTTLQLLHVFEESRVEQVSVAVGLRPQSVRRQALTDAENALDEAADLVRFAGVSFTTELARGTAADSIVTAAERHGAAAIVIGTHGRGALERFLIGSVADAVIRNAHVPVYTVHRRSVKAKQPRAIKVERGPREIVTL